MAERRRSKGRQKIEIKKIESEDARKVTFSKRKVGLFKAASDLSTLCGAEVAILVFSPADNIYSFGHPCVNSIVDRYLNEGTAEEESVRRVVDAYRGAKVRELTRRYTDLLAQLEDEMQKDEKLKATVDANGNSQWEASVDQIHLTDLQHMKFSMSVLKNIITKQIEQTTAQVLFPSPVLDINSVGEADHSFAFQSTMNTVNNAVTGPHDFGLGFQNGLGHGPF